MTETGNENVIGEKLTPKQEAFCQFYTQISSTFGNGTMAYAEAYGFDLENAAKDDAVLDENNKVLQPSTYTRMYAVCASAAGRLLKNVQIDKRIRKLLNEMLTDDVVDARLIEIIMSGKNQDSVNAIKEYNKLKQRIVEKKDITSGGERIVGFQFVRADEVNQTDNQADA